MESTPPPSSTQSSNVDLSICFCAWNEEDNIAACIEDAQSAAKEIAPSGKWEVLVIDNASTDRTPEIVREFQARDARVQLLRHPENRFYSGSHRTAFSKAQGDYVAILDGDHQHTAQDVAKAIRLISERPSCDVVFGWKRTRHDGKLRMIFSLGLRYLSRLIIRHPLHDINCGFRVFKKKAVQTIRIQETINSVGPEIYCECRKQGLGVAELVVQHFPRTQGEGLHDSLPSLLRNTRKFLAYLLKLRRRYSSPAKGKAEEALGAEATQ